MPLELSERFCFQHGQYLTLRVHVEGEELRRSYSICSAVGDPTLTIAIKRIVGGRVSNYAHEHFRAGVSVDVAPPSGEFMTPLDPDRAHAYLCIAAGSGITPRQVEIEGDKTIAWCSCRQSKNFPYCDGSHNKV